MLYFYLAMTGVVVMILISAFVRRKAHKTPDEGMKSFYKKLSWILYGVAMLFFFLSPY